MNTFFVSAFTEETGELSISLYLLSTWKSGGLHVWRRKKKKKNITTNFTKEERKSLDNYNYVSMDLENRIKGGITQ